MGRKFDGNIKVLWHAKKYWGFFPWTFTDYYIIEKEGQWKKLVCVKGLINKQETEMHIYRINDATYKRGLGNMICGTGNLIIQGDEGRNVSIEHLKNIKGAQKAKDFIMDLVESERKSRGIKATELQ